MASQQSPKKQWTRGEKWLWATPLLFGVLAIGLKMGPTLWEQLKRRGPDDSKFWVATPDHTISAISVSGNGDLLAAIVASPTTPERRPDKYKHTGTIHFWNARTGRPLLPIPPAKPLAKSRSIGDLFIYSVILSHDAKLVGYGCGDEKWGLYDRDTQKPLWKFPIAIIEARFSPDERFIALADYDQIFVVNAKDGEVISQWKRNGHANSQDIAWSPDGKQLAVIGGTKNDSPIEIYNVADGRLVRRIENKWTRSLEFSPDGTRLISTQNVMQYSEEEGNGKFAPVRCYDPATGKLLWDFKLKASLDTNLHMSHNDAIFSPDGRIVATFQYWFSEVLLLDTHRGTQLGVLPVEIKPASMSSVPPALAFSPDGKRLFGRGIGGVLVWDLP